MFDGYPAPLRVVRLTHLLGPPLGMLVGRVTFVSKVDMPTEPTDFRPITVSPVAIRVLHKILAARRAREEAVFDSQQFGARPNGGCLNAVFTVASLQRAKATAGQPLSMALLDISKAFPLPSSRSPLPIPYIENLWEDGQAKSIDRPP